MEILLLLFRDWSHITRGNYYTFVCTYIGAHVYIYIYILLYKYITDENVIIINAFKLVYL